MGAKSRSKTKSRASKTANKSCESDHSIEKSNVCVDSTKVSKRKVVSPIQNITLPAEKKHKISDTESIDSGDWFDAEDQANISELLVNQQSQEITMESQSQSQSQSILAFEQPLNSTIINPCTEPFQTASALARPQGQVFTCSMPSPITSHHQVMQTPQSFLSDQDILRIANTVKEVIRVELENMVKSQVRKETAMLQNVIDIIKDENSKLKQSVAELSRKQDNAEQYGRKLNARIGNYKYIVGENTDDVVIDVAKRGDVSLTKDEIDVSHRTGKAKDGSPREIIVKFRTIQSEIKFLKCRKILRANKETIYVSEDLTQYRNELLYHCRQLKNNHNSIVEKTWSFNGNIFIKVKDREDATKITCIDDLKPFRPKERD